jgi:cell division protein FtsB
MKEFEKKAKRKKKLCSNFVILILVIILSIFIKSTFDVYLKQREAKRILNTATEEKTKLETKVDKLEDNIQFLQSDIGKEEKVRNNFLLVKEGEEAVFILDQEEEEEISVEEDGVFSNIWQSFLGLFN